MLRTTVRVMAGMALVAGLAYQGMSLLRKQPQPVRAQVKVPRPHAREKVPGIYLDDQGFQNQVVFSFDDGPNIHTEQVLDLLKQHQIKAVFFVLGSKIQKPDGTLYPDSARLVRRMLAEGHALGNHTFNHPNLSAASYTDKPAKIAQEFTRTQTAVNKALGHSYPLVYVRPPFGQRGVRGLSNPADGVFRPGHVDHWLQQQKYYLVLWSASSGDWHHQQPLWEMEKSVMDGLNARQGGMILMHDIQPRTPLLLKNLLERLNKEKRWRVTTLEALLKLKYGRRAVGF